MKTPVKPGIKLPPILADLGDQVFEFVEQRPCIYFLVKLEPLIGSRIVYIGSSTDISNRLKHHAQKYDYDRVFFIEMESDTHLRELEHALIRSQRPEYNLNGKCGVGSYSPWEGARRALREHGFKVYSEVDCPKCDAKGNEGAHG